MYLRISSIEGLGALPGNYEKQISFVLGNDKLSKVKKVAVFSLIRHIATREEVKISVRKKKLRKYHQRFLKDSALRKAAAWGYSTAASKKMMRLELGLDRLEYRQQVVVSYGEVKDLEYSKFLITKALELDPGDPDYLFEKAIICYSQKEYTQSLRCINQILRENKDDYYLEWKANILFQLQKFPACRKVIDEGLKINPWNQALLGWKVKVLQRSTKKKDIEDAENLLLRLQLFAK